MLAVLTFASQPSLHRLEKVVHFAFDEVSAACTACTTTDKCNSATCRQSANSTCEITIGALIIVFQGADVLLWHSFLHEAIVSNFFNSVEKSNSLICFLFDTLQIVFWGTTVNVSTVTDSIQQGN